MPIQRRRIELCVRLLEEQRLKKTLSDSLALIGLTIQSATAGLRIYGGDRAWACQSHGNIEHARDE